MNIRKGEITDINDIQKLMNDLNSYRERIFSKNNQLFHKREKPYPALKEKDIEANIIFVAEEHQKIVGFIQWSMHERKNHTYNKLWSIEELYVLPEYRKMNIGKKLFTALEDDFKTQSCNHITVHTDFENHISQNFYLNAGMSETTIELWKKI